MKENVNHPSHYKKEGRKECIEEMVRIKSYTDIEQSKKLAEILPLESADMYWMHGKLDNVKQHLIPNIIGNEHDYPLWDFDIPCWSLAALFDVASTHCDRLEIALRADKKYNVFAVKDDFVFRSFDGHPDGFGNLIDACVTVIEELNKLKML